MDAMQAIRSRRSIRRFTSDPVSKADLEAIVDAGRMAATGSNRQPWDFIVVTSRERIEQFMVAGKWIREAPAVIAVVLNPATRWWVEDGSAAIENLLIAATALGLGACWVEGDALPHEEKLKSLLGVPADRKVMALIPVGKPAESPSPEKKPLSQVIHWEKF